VTTLASVGERATERARDILGVGHVTNRALTTWLHGLPGVDQVGCEARAAALGTRSIKTTAKAWGIDMAISMIDLTTLEGADTVATAFPSGRASMPVKLADTADAVAAGADEIDMVIDRGAFLAGDYLTVFEEIVAIKAACRRADGSDAHLKVIMETGELVTYDNVRRASHLSMLAGADFIKTSTGKVQPAATLPVTLILLEAVRDWQESTGVQVGVKPAGGIRTTKDAIKYLVLVNETAGDDWLDPDWFRFGASTLLNDLLMQRTKLTTGVYSGPDYFTLD
jgi:deoxyribose-phosphate aldolase